MKHAPRGPVKASTVDADPSQTASLMQMHPLLAPGAPRCTATGKRNGQPCKNPAIAGGTVCRMHGGSAPHVKAKAQERLLAMQPKAFGTLDRLLDRDEFPTVQMAAVRDVLDRTMGKPTESVAVTGADGGPLVIKWKGARDE
jgi:hypothetical protein